MPAARKPSPPSPPVIRKREADAARDGWLREGWLSVLQRRRTKLREPLCATAHSLGLAAHASRYSADTTSSSLISRRTKGSAGCSRCAAYCSANVPPCALALMRGGAEVFHSALAQWLMRTT